MSDAPIAAHWWTPNTSLGTRMHACERERRERTANNSFVSSWPFILPFVFVLIDWEGWDGKRGGMARRIESHHILPPQTVLTGIRLCCHQHDWHKNKEKVRERQREKERTLTDWRYTEGRKEGRRAKTALPEYIAPLLLFPDPDSIMSCDRCSSLNFFFATFSVR